MTRSTLALVCVTTVVTGPAVALPTTHSPFAPNEDRVLALQSCETARDVSGGAVDWNGTLSFRRGAARLSLHGAAYGIDEMQVFDGSVPVGAPLGVAVDVVFADDVQDDAVCADLNGDGRIDFVVTIWLHGNGLGAAFFRRLVVLSARAGYRVWALTTMHPSPEDFVTFGALAPVALITTEFVQSGSSDYPGPQQRHSYYAYDLWTFRGGDLVSANAIDARFPKYVLMTYRANHKPSVRMDAGRPRVAGQPPAHLGDILDP